MRAESPADWQRVDATIAPCGRGTSNDGAGFQPLLAFLPEILGRSPRTTQLWPRLAWIRAVGPLLAVTRAARGAAWRARHPNPRSPEARETRCRGWPCR